MSSTKPKKQHVTVFSYKEYKRYISGEKDPKYAKNWQKFGKNYGFGVKKWIKAHGDEGQKALATHIVQESLSAHWMNKPAPYSTYEVVRAQAFLENVKFYPHKYELSKITELQTFNAKMLYGARKVLSPEDKEIVEKLRKEIKLISNRQEKREAKERLRRFIDKAKIEPYKKALGLDKQSIDRQKEASKKLRNELEGLVGIKELKEVIYKVDKWEEERLKSLDAKLEGRDIGVAVGEGINQDKDYDRLIACIKRGGRLRIEQLRGIVKKRELMARIKRECGKEKHDRILAAAQGTNKFKKGIYIDGNRPPRQGQRTGSLYKHRDTT